MAGHAPAAGSFEAVVREGARVKMCFGGGASRQPMQWYGGLVGGVNGAGLRIIGFDDGEMRAFPMEKNEEPQPGRPKSLREDFDLKILTACAAEDGGIVANESGHAAAADFVTLTDRTKTKTVGVLVGACGELCEGMPMYQDFYVAAGVFPPPEAPRRQRARSSAAAPPASTGQDRQGLHTCAPQLEPATL